MTTRYVMSWAPAAALATAAVMFLYRQFPARTQVQGSPAAVSEQLNARELRFADGAPQLNFTKVESVESLPEPLLDPLSARIAYDENHTSRINSPIAGCVTRIFVEPGDRVAPGQALILVDSPEFAAASPVWRCVLDNPQRLLPAALSHGIGSETQRPFAVVIVGGIVSATLFTLLLLPMLFPLFADEYGDIAGEEG